MKHLYVENCKCINPVSETVYWHIFNEEKLHFHAPQKDTCQQCDKFKFQLGSAEESQKNSIKIQHELHLRKAEKARESMKYDVMMMMMMIAEQN